MRNRFGWPSDELPIGLILVGAAAAIVAAAINWPRATPPKKRVFLSFIYEDVQTIRGLRLLAANPDYDLEFYDESVTVAIDSQNAEYVKRKIREKINRTSVTVCFISANTHLSPWVDWELEESNNKGNAIIAMALKGTDRAVLPGLIKAKGLTFYPWDPANLSKLIAAA